MTLVSAIPGKLGVRLLRCKHYLSVCAVVMFLGSGQGQQLPQVPADTVASPAASQVVEIPDGTPVRLRFAQPLRGRVPCLWKPNCLSSQFPPAKVNEKVRLVAGADVRLNDLVVVAKGALGQATVTKVWHPFMALTGLALQLDWIEDVTGQQLSLRIAKQGKAKPFTVEVLATSGGMVAQPETLHGDLMGHDAIDASLIWRKKNWIPAGTRVLGFVHGSVSRDLATVRDAQALLPVSNDVADITVYRTKGENGRPRVICDGKEIGQIGASQYLVFELAPGKHGCQAESQAPPTELTVLGGEEYFLSLQASVSGSWELKRVDIGEGEDIVAGLEPVPGPQANTQK